MRSMLRLFVFPLALMFLSPAMAAESVVQSVAKQATGVSLTLPDGRLELRPVTDGAIRVRFSDGKTPETPSFVMSEKLPTPKFDVRETPSAVTISTAKMTAAVDRATGAVTFLDKAGRVFLAEKPGSRVFQPVTLQGRPSFTVGQTFLSPAGRSSSASGNTRTGCGTGGAFPWKCASSTPRSPCPC